MRLKKILSITKTKKILLTIDDNFEVSFCFCGDRFDEFGSIIDKFNQTNTMKHNHKIMNLVCKEIKNFVYNKKPKYLIIQNINEKILNTYIKLAYRHIPVKNIVNVSDDMVYIFIER